MKKEKHNRKSLILIAFLLLVCFFILFILVIAQIDINFNEYDASTWPNSASKTNFIFDFYKLGETSPKYPNDGDLSMNSLIKKLNPKQKFDVWKTLSEKNQITFWGMLNEDNKKAIWQSFDLDKSVDNRNSYKLKLWNSLDPEIIKSTYGLDVKNDQYRKELFEKVLAGNSKELNNLALLIGNHALENEKYLEEFKKLLGDTTGKTISLRGVSGFDDKNLKYLGNNKFGITTNDGKTIAYIDMANLPPWTREVGFKDGKFSVSFDGRLSGYKDKWNIEEERKVTFSKGTIFFFEEGVGYMANADPNKFDPTKLDPDKDGPIFSLLHGVYDKKQGGEIVISEKDGKPVFELSDERAVLKVLNKEKGDIFIFGKNGKTTITDVKKDSLRVTNGGVLINQIGAKSNWDRSIYFETSDNNPLEVVLNQKKEGAGSSTSGSGLYGAAAASGTTLKSETNNYIQVFQLVKADGKVVRDIEVSASNVRINLEEVYNTLIVNKNSKNIEVISGGAGDENYNPEKTFYRLKVKGDSGNGMEIWDRAQNSLNERVLSFIREGKGGYVRYEKNGAWKFGNVESLISDVIAAGVVPPVTGTSSGTRRTSGEVDMTPPTSGTPPTTTGTTPPGITINPNAGVIPPTTRNSGRTGTSDTGTTIPPTTGTTPSSGGSVPTRVEGHVDLGTGETTGNAGAAVQFDGVPPAGTTRGTSSGIPPSGSAGTSGGVPPTSGTVGCGDGTCGNDDSSDWSGGDGGCGTCPPRGPIRRLIWRLRNR